MFRPYILAIFRELQVWSTATARMAHVLYKPTQVTFLIIKPTRCTNFSNLFWNESLHVSDSSSVYHQELFTVHSAMVYVTQDCRQLSSRIRIELQFHPDPNNRYWVPACTVIHTQHKHAHRITWCHTLTTSKLMYIRFLTLKTLTSTIVLVYYKTSILPFSVQTVEASTTM
jgi:hypothetical protein